MTSATRSVWARSSRCSRSATASFRTGFIPGDFGITETRRPFAWAVRFARGEGFLPAPESAHALRAVAQEAAAAREAGEKRVILFGLSGHGHFDMSAYDAYFAGKLEDIELSQSRIDAAIEELPRVPAMT